MRPTFYAAALLLVACDPGTPEDTTDEPAADDRDDTSSPAADDTALPAIEATWHGGVAPLLAQKCGGCHVEGGVAPFAVDTYPGVRRWVDAIAQSVSTKSMPPFDAREDECDTPLPWQHDLRLTDDEIDLLVQWADDGAPVGDPDAARPVPGSVPERLEDPDAVVQIAEPFEVSGDRDIYQCFRVTVPNTEDVWLKAIDVLPDNDHVVHHVLVWNDPQDLSAAKAGEDGTYRCSGTPDIFPTDLVGTWTPGAGVVRTPENTGMPLKAGGTLVVNVHYHPEPGVPQMDQSSVALEWTTERPDHHVTWFLVDLPFGGRVRPGPNDPEDGAAFRIPANVADHRETVELDTAPYAQYINLLTLGQGLKIFGVTPHMHYLGTGMKVWVERADEDADDTCLVHTPDYRFDWQTTYLYDNADTVEYADLPTVMGGDRIVIQCDYDNTMGNPYIGDALAARGTEEPTEVRWGEETGDEMCMAMVGFVIPPVDIGDLLGGLF